MQFKQNINIKLIQTLILAMALVFLGACASGKKSSKKSTSPAPQTQTTTPDVILPPAEAEPTPPEMEVPPVEASFYKVIDVDVKPTFREFRGVWIATIGNIDWPTSSTDAFSKQKEDFIKLLDHYQKLNFNVVIVQVRTSGDAFYPSQFAPWSRYLTGKEGKKPQTDEDPLTWMISETHKYGMEFHAWFNPYRATVDLDLKKISAGHDYHKHPDWMIKYSTKYYYNPALPEVQKHLTEVIREVVENYDIDAIHFDDYFYPYVVDKVKFEDGVAFKKYGKPGQKLEDWRRENVNSLIRSVHEMIESTKPWVQFGISPFGVWRNIDRDPEGSKTRAGQTNFDHLYADPITWMKHGWIDYLIPQLYWSMEYNLASYRELVSWWSRNSHNTKIYVGNGPYKIRDNVDKAWDDPMEIPNQITLSRATPNLSGNAYFSARSLFQKNRDVSTLIFNNHYFQPAFPPQFESKRTFESVPGAKLIPNEHGYSLLFDEEFSQDFRYLVIYSGTSLYDIANKTVDLGINKIHLQKDSPKEYPVLNNGEKRYLAISFLDHFGRESKITVFEINANL